MILSNFGSNKSIRMHWNLGGTHHLNKNDPHKKHVASLNMNITLAQTKHCSNAYCLMGTIPESKGNDSNNAHFIIDH